MKEIKVGTKFTDEGWVQVEKIEPVADVGFKALTGLLIDERGATSIDKINEFLERANGYKVKLHIEIIDVPENKPHITKVPAPGGYCAKCSCRIQ